MKVFLHYEDHDDKSFHKSLKITLPKSWKTGPSSNLLKQFVESYNSNPDFGGSADKNPLPDGDDELLSRLHLAMRQEVGPSTSTSTSTSSTTTTPSPEKKVELVPICSDAVVVDEIPDRMDVYICHGPSQTLEERRTDKQRREELLKEQTANLVSCVRFGCQNRFPKGGPYPSCRYHKSPPIFHETAKWWSCCPQRKAWDFDDFQKIPGCCQGMCTDVKEEDASSQKLFLGGADLREQAAGRAQLKSIDDFNKAQSAGGSDAAPVLDRLRVVLQELGVEQELYDQVVDGIKKDLAGDGTAGGASDQQNGGDGDDADADADVLAAVANELGSKFKTMLKATAAEQLRIKK
mmetsp:Transcript_48471/g.117279  ORF Transcript_48471/g.117279 Transcript_48471/m.117279 type:complete len:349 (-) Transcript_48471:200-1246(-)